MATNQGLNLSINIQAQTETSELSALLEVLKKLGVNVDELKPEVNSLSSELDDLAKQQQLVELFRSLQSAVGDTQKSLDTTKSKLRELTTELNAVDNPSQQLISTFKQTNTEVAKLEATLSRQQNQLKEVGARFTSVGLEANSLSAAQSKISSSSEALSVQLQDVKSKLEGIAKSASEQRAVDEALKTLGIDAEQLATGITKTERAFLDAFRTISTSAKSTEEQLRSALVTTLQGVQAPQALRQLDNELKDLAASGRLTAEQINGLRSSAAKPIPDPTSELRTGAHDTANIMGDLKQTVLGFLALDAFKRFTTDTINASRATESALKGLESVARGTGLGISAAYNEATKIAATGVLSLTEASASLQNLLSRGYNIEQAVSTINRLTDAAAFNRQTHLAWGEAVVSATEGLRNENSELVDNAGVTKNVSVIWQEYADLVGKSVDELTKQEKIQAEVNGVMKETEIQAGNTSVALQGVEGDLAKMNKSIEEMQVAIGKNLTPAMAGSAAGIASLTGFVTPAIGAWDKFVVTIAFSIDKLLALKDGLLNLENPTQKIAALTAAYQQSLQDIDKQFGTFTDGVKENAAALTEQAGAQKTASAETAAAARIQAQAAEDVRLALKGLGVSISDINTGMTKAERDSVASLTTIAASAETTGSVLSTSLLSALQKIEGNVGLVHFREQLDAIVASGRVTGVELENLTRLQSAVNDTIGKGAYSLDAFRGSLDNTKDSFANSVTASDQFGQSLKTLGIDAEQAATGMDASFKEIVVTLSALAESGKLTGTILSESLSNAIKTADTKTELAALDTLIKQLGEDGKISGNEMTLALDAVENKLIDIKGATDPVIKAFELLGVASSASLKQAAQDAKDAFDIIRASGTATTGDLTAAFAAMAEKVLAAGEAAGPFGLAMAEASLKAQAGTEAQQKALEELIVRYEDSGAAATAASQQQVVAANQAASAIENYSARVEARAGAGANAFQSVTNAIQQTTNAANAFGQSQERVIQGYDDLNEEGKKWADNLIRQAVAADNAQAGMMTYRDQTGRTIKEIQRSIASEEEAAKQVELLSEQYDAGSISARSLAFQLNSLILQLQDPMTTAGQSALRTLQDLQKQIQDTQNTITQGASLNSVTSGATRRGGSLGGNAGVVNVNIAGIIDLQPRTLDELSRKLQPYFEQINRRSA